MGPTHLAMQATLGQFLPPYSIFRTVLDMPLAPADPFYQHHVYFFWLIDLAN